MISVASRGLELTASSLLAAGKKLPPGMYPVAYPPRQASFYNTIPLEQLVISTIGISMPA
ncbi:MAG: hypothetical protein JRH08_18690 [Deltaproteobacteria bacterium]|nr:hypothetical protein [Deltaproteobacteria bacterium]MBW2027282.1 hypothetical protein [Deltaproteobacteria bacterium]MBW2127616.1 hypothetical protein [Deltaproteobacteria bacterium]